MYVRVGRVPVLAVTVSEACVHPVPEIAGKATDFGPDAPSVRSDASLKEPAKSGR